MKRLHAITAMGAIAAFLASACEALIGDVEVSQRPKESMGTMRAVPTPPQQAGLGLPPIQYGSIPEQPLTGPIIEQPASADARSSDAGTSDAAVPPDAASTPPPRPIVVAPPAPLALVGVVGGGPRLGSCTGGLVIGVRVTANPSAEAFGQRLTFIEPLCASASVLGGATSPTVELTRNDALVSWSTAEPFLGVPSAEVPDPRLVWVPQPPSFCPDSAPVLVGLSGQFDPVAPDDTETAALRSLVIECAPLALEANGVDLGVAPSGHLLISQADNFSATGAETYRSSCAGGTAVTQIQIHSGFWLDGFVLGCSALRAPRPAGEACATGQDCASGACGAEGACGP